jgi:hypothetical protein
MCVLFVCIFGLWREMARVCGEASTELCQERERERERAATQSVE